MTNSREAHPFIWRGIPQSNFTLQSTLDRYLREKGHQAHNRDSILHERNLLRAFQDIGRGIGGSIEERYIAGNLNESPEVWSVIAAARHVGLPTRALDWTTSPWVAAYFACFSTNSSDPLHDGSIVWVEQRPLQDFLHRTWNNWDVPLRRDYYREEQGSAFGDFDQRALEARAFLFDCPQWVSKLHFSLPFERLEKQQGCFTVCGRILTDQNDAFDWMDPNGILPRGRILIPREAKKEILKALEQFNIRAASLGFPALDVIARSLCP